MTSSIVQKTNKDNILQLTQKQTLFIIIIIYMCYNMHMKTTPLKFDDLAPDLEVQTAAGETIRLSSLWAMKTLVLAFTRHFGCPQCKEMLSELVRVNPELEKAGFTLAVITQGTPKEMDAFCRQFAPGILCLSDPDRRSTGPSEYEGTH